MPAASTRDRIVCQGICTIGPDDSQSALSVFKHRPFLTDAYPTFHLTPASAPIVVGRKARLRRHRVAGTQLALYRLCMKTTRSCEPRRHAVITVRPSNDLLRDDLLVMVPESGTDVDAVERALIAFALEKTGGNRTHAARFLGLSRSALLYRMHKHGLCGEESVDRRGPQGNTQ